MIHKLSDMQRTACQNGYAIPHVLGGNIEMTYGAVRAAEMMNSPIAIGVAPEVFASVSMEITFPMILNIIERAKVPVAVQLEHGKSYKQIATAIKLGVNSVMFDGSSLSYEENIEKTKEIVKMAHAFNTCVEAELGYVGGSAIRELSSTSGSHKTDPGMVNDFIQRTNIDSLAISFGNVHGHYQGEPNIDLELAKTIVSLSSIPIVMHGGSGLPDDMYQKIVATGVSNIHFYSGVAMYAWEYLKEKIGEEDRYPPYHEIVSKAVDFFKEKTMHIIGLLGSGNKANDFQNETSQNQIDTNFTENVSKIIADLLSKTYEI